MISTNDTVLVSVIIPVYNGEEFVGQALESALRQTHHNLDIIVVDDGSIDGTRSIVDSIAAKDSRVRVIIQANGGVARARNRAIAASRGEYIAPLDADDLWAPTKIERQLRRMLEAGPDTGLVYSWWVWIDQNSSVLDRSPRWMIEGDALEMLLRVVFIGNASVPLFRRSCLEYVGGYNEDLADANAEGCEDWEIGLRVAHRYRVAVVPDVLVGYRRRPGSMSLGIDRMWRSRELVVQGIHKLRPALKPIVFQQSARQFALYLAGLSFWWGDLPGAFRWALRAGLRLPLLVFPHVLKLLLTRLLREPAEPQIMVPGVELDLSRIDEPLLPYDRIYKRHTGALALPPSNQLRPSRRRYRLNPTGIATHLLTGATRLLRAVKRHLRDLAARAVHRLLLARMSAEAYLSRLNKGPRKPRILATACWHFPIYSQTFVYREVMSLATHEFEVRFAYTGLASRRQLSDECAVVWRLKRRLVLADAAATNDLEHYQRRMPKRVKELTRMIGQVSGLTPDEVLAHRHVRHAFSFTRMAEAWKADYLHTYFFYEATVFGFVASFLLGIPRGVSCYADHMVDDYELKFVALQLQSCAVIVATSGRIKDELEMMAGHALPAAIVKPNGIDASRFVLTERTPSHPGRVFRLVSISRIHPKKGLTYLLQAALVLRDRKLSFLLEILGEPDAHDTQAHLHYKELKAFVADHRLENMTKFRGRKTALEVRQHLAQADVFVAPFVELPNGDKDGIPTALLEAMAAGCAIVSTGAGSILEVIDDGVEGIIVPQFDSAALAESILRLAADADLRAHLSRGAIDRVRRDFDVSHCEASFHERVRTAVASSRYHSLQAIRVP